MKLSEKQKTLSQYLPLFFKSTSNFGSFERKRTLISFVIPNLRTAKDVIREMSKKPRFRTPFDSQHAKGIQKLLKSALQHFYHIFPLLL